jgi:hypothetical protein
MTSMKSIYLFFIIPILFLFYSCYSVPIFSIQSDEKDSDFFMGKEYLTKEDTSASVTLDFEDQENGIFLFYVEIKSYQDTPFIFDPGKIYEQIVEPELRNYQISALDPETQIETINQSIRSTNERKSVDDNINTFVAIADLIGEVVTIGKEKSKQEVSEKQKAREDWQNTVENEEINYQESITKLNEKKDFWQNNVIRKTTMHITDTLKGFFYIPSYENAAVIKITIPVGCSQYSFKYKQTKK